ncbi:MAG: hypothetical protein ABIK98_05595 [Pseudomonadota bacterium]|uniref:Uncharacterized protein n=1 Tax=Candidatus Desulfatibia profunda TaxID=2841695 RepID=A0A8J6TKC5_9BACT|nr:hypothetical protein [Candidatus Desulfatibia profunda]MBL7179144.1 hypothetical protein [Desulfobacterales bacterium]MBU0698284.1 hypothetical protein [Pseudomonadota bacterium]
MKRQQMGLESPNALRPWVIKGVTFPHGTEFRSKYKGYFYYGKVFGGALVLKGKRFLSPSAAAVSITRNPVDGWVFWHCKLPGHSCWVNICEFKNNRSCPNIS